MHSNSHHGERQEQRTPRSHTQKTHVRSPRPTQGHRSQGALRPRPLWLELFYTTTSSGKDTPPTAPPREGGKTCCACSLSRRSPSQLSSRASSRAHAWKVRPSPGCSRSASRNAARAPSTSLSASSIDPSSVCSGAWPGAARSPSRNAARASAARPCRASSTACSWCVLPPPPPPAARARSSSCCACANRPSPSSSAAHDKSSPSSPPPPPPPAPSTRSPAAQSRRPARSIRLALSASPASFSRRAAACQSGAWPRQLRNPSE
mmetsp:Transcript_30585/g.96489  ORF Transcript_30585/g.96489 Transcript_30585/m.96489 type:complete len:263 (-) Transcript_30585:1253-2041(-)